MRTSARMRGGVRVDVCVVHVCCVPSSSIRTVTPIRMNVLVRFRATSNNIGENREQINIIALS